MKNSIHDLVLIALFSALISASSLLPVPGAVPFTMQSFAVYLTVYVLGAKRAFFSIAVYTLLGLVGLPVFSGFTGGVGVLFGKTGGFLAGFLLVPLFFTGKSRSAPGTAAASVLSLVICYSSGALWYMFLYGGGIISALALTVMPFIIPDAFKIWSAYLLAQKIKKIVK